MPPRQDQPDSETENTMSRHPTSTSDFRRATRNFLIPGDAYLAAQPDFQMAPRPAEQMMISEILTRSSSNNLILTGRSGVGITSLLMSLEAEKQNPDAPFDIASKTYHWLDTDGLFSSGNKADIERNFEKVLRTLSRCSDSVLIIQNVREFINAAQKRDCLHFINSLMISLDDQSGRQEFQVVLECRDHELKEIIESHPYIKQNFSWREISEPRPEELQAIVTAGAKKLEHKHRIKLTPEFIATAIRLTQQYHLPQIDCAQPERALTFIDLALSSLLLRAHAKPQPGMADEEWKAFQDGIRKIRDEQRREEIAIDEVEEKLEDTLREQMNDASAPTSAHAEDLRLELQRKEQIVAGKKAEYDALVDKINSSLSVSEDDVLVKFSALSGIPVNSLKLDQSAKLLNLESILGARMNGQKEAITATVEAIRGGMMGLKKAGEPVGFLIFLGASGAGKTALAKGLASALNGDDSALRLYNMTEYNPKNQEAADRFRDDLVRDMRRRPRRVNLFDEIEKGHPDIPNFFLKIMDDGGLSDSMGLEAQFGESINIMTSNIGQDYFYDETLSFEEASKRALADLRDTSKSGFRNEVINRANAVCCFSALTTDEINEVIRKRFADLNSSLAEKGVVVKITDSDLAALCKDHYTPRGGARSVLNFIKSKGTDRIAVAMLRNPDVKGTVHLKYTPQNHRLETDFIASPLVEIKPERAPDSSTPVP